MNWDYIAGFFDGEGSCWKAKNKRHLVVDISQKDPSPLIEIKKFLSEQNIYCTMRLHSVNKWGYKMTKLSILRTKDGLAFLECLKDKVILKREKIYKLLSDYENFIPKYPVFTENQKTQVENLMKSKVPYIEIKNTVGLRSVRQIDYIKKMKNIPNYY